MFCGRFFCDVGIQSHKNIEYHFKYLSMVKCLVKQIKYCILQIYLNTFGYSVTFFTCVQIVSIFRRMANFCAFLFRQVGVKFVNVQIRTVTL